MKGIKEQDRERGAPSDGATGLMHHGNERQPVPKKKKKNQTGKQNKKTSEKIKQKRKKGRQERRANLWIFSFFFFLTEETIAARLFVFRGSGGGVWGRLNQVYFNNFSPSTILQEAPAPPSHDALLVCLNIPHS